MIITNFPSPSEVIFHVTLSLSIYISPIKLPPPLSQMLLEVPDFPREPDRGSHTVPLKSLLYIERSDFMEEGEGGRGRGGFRRLTPSQPVGLKYTSSAISVQQVVKVSVSMSMFRCSRSLLLTVCVCVCVTRIEVVK